LRWAEGAQRDGRIQHLGFSFHDSFEIFKEIVDAYEKWTFCQIQYNYMDVEYQAGIKGLKYAAKKGLPVAIMEPLRGGQLAKEPPESVARFFTKAPERRSPADWALQWGWNHSEVSVVLSGMTTMQHVEENLVSADRSAPGSLTDTELSLIDQAREAYRELSPIPCTMCRYCMPCPNGVIIPRILELHNDAIIYSAPRKERFLYRQLQADQQATNCEACGECEEACPQDIPISEWLKKAHDWLGPRKKS